MNAAIQAYFMTLRVIDTLLIIVLVQQFFALRRCVEHCEDFYRWWGYAYGRTQPVAARAEITPQDLLWNAPAPSTYPPKAEGR
jgi:hypothetical protein